MTQLALKDFSTFKIGGISENVFVPKTQDEFLKLLVNTTNAMILGACSNVLISDFGVVRPIVFTTKLSEFKFNETLLTTQCGVKGTLLAKKAAELNLSGLEFMIGFPGTVGGMVYMNAGAHGQCIADSFVFCNIFDLEKKKILQLNKSELKFDYRKSILSEQKYILLDAVFNLDVTEKTLIEARMQHNLDFRKQYQPSLKWGNVGSIFKNGTNYSAAKLLDSVGAKNLSVGGAKVYEKHANFIINYDNATSLDVCKLMLKMYELVKKEYNIELVPEVKYLGGKSKEETEIWDIMLNN